MTRAVAGWLKGQLADMVVEPYRTPRTGRWVIHRSPDEMQWGVLGLDGEPQVIAHS